MVMLSEYTKSCVVESVVGAGKHLTMSGQDQVPEKVSWQVETEGTWFHEIQLPTALVGLAGKLHAELPSKEMAKFLRPWTIPESISKYTEFWGAARLPVTVAPAALVPPKLELAALKAGGFVLLR